MAGQSEKAERFAALHKGPDAFVVPNPWDVGTARLLRHLGFPALATTGGGFAFSIGRPDGSTTKEELLGYIASIANASDLPVTADLEDGFGDDPGAVYKAILDVAGAGAVGASIEDRSYGVAPRRPDETPYDIGFASERVLAAVQAARTLPFPFIVTARCENFLIGRTDLADTIRRLQAYQEAGADCLYAPGLNTKVQLRDVVRSVDRPVNAIMGRAGDLLSHQDLTELGVRRISLGSTLSRVALGAFIAAATEIRERGTCTFAAAAIPHDDMDRIFA